MIRNSEGTTGARFGAAMVGIICGAELVVAAVVAGAGVGAFFGLEGAFVAAIAAFLFVNIRRRTNPNSPTNPLGVRLLNAFRGQRTRRKDSL